MTGGFIQNVQFDLEDFIQSIQFDLFTVELVIVDTATAMLLNTKVDKIEGKGLSSNDFTDEEKQEISDNTLAIEEINKLLPLIYAGL